MIATHPGRRFRLLAGLVALVPAALGAQDPLPTGRIVGRIVDAKSGIGLSDVGLQVVGSTTGTMTGVDGRFTLANVRAGTVTLHARRIGFTPKTVTGILLAAEGVVEQNIALDPVSVQLQAQVVTAAAERGTVSEALDAQRNASGIVNAVTAEQIAKSPDSDAAQAVQRVSGVTVQDGRYVFVRGLGERYTTTSLNGARIPSPEPERKVVPLDLFPSNLLQSVTTSKTFTPDQPGDFSGALVDLKTREFPARRQTSYSASIGYNSLTTGRSVLLAPRERMDWLGYGGTARALPAPVAAGGDFSGNYSADEYGRIAGSFRNAWSVRNGAGAPNGSASMSFGGSDPIGGRRIGYVGALTYSLAREIRADEVRAFAVPTPDGGTSEVDRFEGGTGRESALWGGLLNLGTLLGNASRLSWNNTYTRSADNEARYEEGFDENTALPFQIQRLRYVERSVWSSQLAGEHEPNASHRLQWQITGSGVSRVEPDRSEVVYAVDEAGGTPFLFGSNEGAVRTFGDLTEYSYSGGADYHFRFGGLSTPHAIKIGGLFRYTDRDARNSSYSVQANLPREDRERAPEEIFDGRFSQPGSNVFRVVALSQGGSYKASDVLGAGYAMVEYQLSDRLRAITGARLESQALEVIAQPLFGAAVKVTPTYVDVLPAGALTMRLTDGQNLRFSLSQTLARPEYREIVPIGSRDVIGGEQFRGNPLLKRTLIQNLDLRWEWYPNAGEVVSAGVFAKRFQDPIERVYRGTSGTRVTTFENAAEARNYGAELELRKDLAFLGEPLMPFTFFSNLTVMQSSIDLRNVGAGSVEADRAMVGQAPYVVNTGLTYALADRRVSATALYNVVGRRIYAASLLPLPSVYEESRNVVDLSLRFPIGPLGGRLDAKNVLDAPYEVTQGTVVREHYRAGRIIQVGLSWTGH